ncbi:hypothetical protein M9Y10_033545 [Tritrichomonas musculus]|uniref:ATPase AAA-type core domain-containing protein n=1 Tax=Tritrichomonas musculus TaxID=1915356 RepID=A0ABR2KCE8_9EUKA
MKPRHLKANKNNSKSSKPSNKSDKIFTNEKSQLLSNLIPFYKTNQYYQLLEWIKNWSQSQPSCLLFGPTSCGKSTLIHNVASELLCHIVEIDCASISNIKELVLTFQEATKSRSVGIFLNHNNTNYDNAISMVVLEHVDSIISLHANPPSSLINMISKSLVPLIMTAQNACLSSAETKINYDWLKIISVDYCYNSFPIIKSSKWLKNSINQLSTNQGIHSLLSFADQDIRRTALQYQVWGDDSNSILTRERQIYLSIPICVQEIQDPKERRELYADLLDVFVSVNHDDQFYKSYIRHVSNDFKSYHREQLFKSYVEFSKDRVKRMPMGAFEDLELTEIVYQACLNDVSQTRTTTKPNLPPGHKIKSSEISYVKSWSIWPYIDRDITEDKTEVQNEEKPIIEKESPNEKEKENESEPQTKNEEAEKKEPKRRGRRRKK